MTTREDLQLSLDAYDAKVAKAIAKFPERQHLSEKRLYTPLDIDEKFDYNSKLGFPGQYPFTRGVQPTMYRGRLWTMRAYAGFATAEETNARYKYLLQAGQTGLSVAMDLPTQIGLDSDAPLSEGEVGKVGVAIDSLADMEKLFEGIPLDKVSTSMTINGPAAVLLAMYVAVAEKQGVKPEQLKGTIQNDILKEYIARGTYIFPPRPSMRLITDTFAYCSQNIPKWNTISVGAYHIREAGASEVQEIAFAFANAMAYIDAAIKAGQKVDDFAPGISWIFTAGLNFFSEIAKFRAARRLWARIMKERYGATVPKAQMLRVHVHTAGSVLTAQQPLNNVARITWQAMSAVLAGIQSMACCAYDEPLPSRRKKVQRLHCVPNSSSLTKVVLPTLSTPWPVLIMLKHSLTNSKKKLMNTSKKLMPWAVRLLLSNKAICKVKWPPMPTNIRQILKKASVQSSVSTNLRTIRLSKQMTLLRQI